MSNLADQRVARTRVDALACPGFSGAEVIAGKVLGVRGAHELAMVAASAGLASNLAAPRALATDDIQHSCRALYARAATAARSSAASLQDGGPLASCLAKLGPLVEARISAALDEVRDKVAAEARPALPVLEQVRALTLRGGKRQRTLLVLAGADAVAPWDVFADAVVDVAAAVEVFQAYLLIHDDWMDGDLVRRGGPTVHAALTRELADANRGAACAVLAGDLASALAQRLLATPHVPSARLRALFDVFAEVQCDVLAGQVMDILGAGDHEQVAHLKTGSYTLRGPLLLGWALAGGDNETRRELEDYAVPLGLAFQLRDDVLGLFGDEAKTGKPTGGDLREGKRTAPITYALDRLPRVEAEELAGLVARRGADAGALGRVRALVARSDALDALEARIVDLHRQAVRAVATDAVRSSARVLLEELAAALVDRDR